MSKPVTLNVRVSGALGAFVAANERIESERLAMLRAELLTAFAAPEFAYQPLDADAVIARNAHR